jgi:hypothetical protein
MDPLLEQAMLMHFLHIGEAEDLINLVKQTSKWDELNY